ncbi:hypothetical protein AGMMS49975_10010 [Clostridia bacterium]|nr:hypothetical protein AGMMS49975_10010 [Clostridia bacterium]
MISFDDFAASGARKDIKQVDLNLVAVKKLSEMNTVTQEELQNGTYIPVCDGALWVATAVDGKGNVGYYSGDGETVFKPNTKFGGLVGYALRGKRLVMGELSNFEFRADEKPDLDLTKNEEATTMAADTRLGDMFDETDETVGGSGDGSVKLMSGFEKTDGDGTPIGGEEKKGKGKTKEKTPEEIEREKNRKDFQQGLNKVITDVKSGISDKARELDTTLLEKAWKDNAEFIAFIAPQDKRHVIAGVKEPLTADNRVPRDDLTEAQRMEAVQNPDKVPKEYFKPIYHIAVKESRPGKAVGVIVKVPAFLKDLGVSDYVKSVALQGASKFAQGDDRTTTIELMSYGDFVNKLVIAGSSINEAKETSMGEGNPGKLVVESVPARSVYGAIKSKVTIVQNILVVHKLRRDGMGNKTLYHDKNYFPLKTYETVDVNSQMSDEQIYALNQYMIGTLFNPIKKDSSDRRYDFLVEADKLNVTKVGTEITSNYVTNDASKRIQLAVKAFYDKEKTRDAILLPLKRRGKKQNGEEASAQFIAYDVTDADKMGNSELDYRAKSALGNGQFQHIIDLVGEDNLAAATLKAKFKTRNTASSANKVGFTQTESRQLAITKILGGGGQFDMEGIAG